MRAANAREVGGRRAAVLRVLRQAEGPLDAARLAARLGVHPNTVRFHLDGLEHDGEVERVPSTAGRPGRPAVRYRAVPGRGERRYELLAGILLDGLDPARAHEAGAAWGRRRARERHAQAPTGELLELLAETGFAPAQTAPDAVELRNCPFRELVDGIGRSVCALHAGMMAGALEAWGDTVRLAALDPAAAPRPCRARLIGTGVAA